MTGKNNNLIELLTVLCLFLAIGADWNALGGNIMTTHSTILEHFQVAGSSYVEPHIAERAVNQAIAAAERREQEGKTARDKISVGVMGERYTVTNLKFNGWKREYRDPGEMALEKIRRIHTLGLEASIKGLVRFHSEFNPQHSCYTVAAYPVDTETFNQSFSVFVVPKHMTDNPDVPSNTTELFEMDSVVAFLEGLLETNRPFAIGEGAA